MKTTPYSRKIRQALHLAYWAKTGSTKGGDAHVCVREASRPRLLVATGVLSGATLQIPFSNEEGTNKRVRQKSGLIFQNST